MRRWFVRPLCAPLLIGALFVLVGCERQGPAERAGEDIDEAAGEVRDALDPGGPAEEAGEAVDDALNQ